MNSQRESMAGVSFRILSCSTERPGRTRPRRFRPLAERMETRVVPGALIPGPAVVPVAAIAIVEPHGDPGMPSALRPSTPDEIEVNGQVEIEPGD